MCLMRMSQSQEDGSMPIVAACFDPSTENGSFWAPANMGGWKGPAVKIEYEELTNNEDSKKILWEKSELACGKLDL